MSLTYLVSLTDFFFLNPEIDANYINLELGEVYYIKAVCLITSYPNDTATRVLPIIVAPVNFT